MKTNKLIMSAMMALTLGGVMTSCNDFDDINNSPLSTGGDKIKPYYSLLTSIKGAQMDPQSASVSSLSSGQLLHVRTARTATTFLQERPATDSILISSDTSRTGCVTPTHVSSSFRSLRAHGQITRQSSIPTCFLWLASGAFR